MSSLYSAIEVREKTPNEDQRGRTSFEKRKIQMFTKRSAALALATGALMVTACNPDGQVLKCASTNGELCIKAYNVPVPANGRYVCRSDGPAPNPVNECASNWVGVCEFGPAADGTHSREERFWYNPANAAAFALACTQAQGTFRYQGQDASIADAGSDAQ